MSRGLRDGRPIISPVRDCDGGHGTAGADEPGVEVVVTDREGKLIRAWYRSHGSERGEVAGKILLVEIAALVVHDVLEDDILG